MTAGGHAAGGHRCGLGRIVAIGLENVQMMVQLQFGEARNSVAGVGVCGWGWCVWLGSRWWRWW